MDDPYEAIRNHFETVDGATVNSGRGSQGVKFGTKMFVMFYKGELLVRLPPERVKELVSHGVAKPFDPGTGKVMPDRALVPQTEHDGWIGLCEESKRYAESIS